MNTDLKAHIEYLLSVKIKTTRPVSGGDISQTYLLETETERFFCKFNSGANALELFQAEQLGLEAISQTKTIATPKVFLCEKLDDGALLLMEYIEPKRAVSGDLELFGHQLATLHQHSSKKEFGWEADNFIGNLPQSNKRSSDWAEFYVRNRLLPQINRATESGLLSSLEYPSEERLLKSCQNYFPEIKPSILHGDLWGGNYLISRDGAPFLIDPAVYYGHHEVDIAMTHLFGGFGSSFYNAYYEIFPRLDGENERHKIYQLYYLLVHLNLFGASYSPSVLQILKTYF